jgi:hypothetical protein
MTVDPYYSYQLKLQFFIFLSSLHQQAILKFHAQAIFRIDFQEINKEIYQ